MPFVFMVNTMPDDAKLWFVFGAALGFLFLGVLGIAGLVMRRRK